MSEVVQTPVRPPIFYQRQDAPCQRRPHIEGNGQGEAASTTSSRGSRKKTEKDFALHCALSGCTHDEIYQRLKVSESPVVGGRVIAPTDP